jgi:hypothetical protein
MKQMVRRLLLVASAASALSACTQTHTGSEIQQGPVGVGTSVNELKGTPCACMEIPMILPALETV